MDYSILSDIGEKRQTNQDYANTFTNAAGSRLFLLADGMGGHNAGDVASKLAVEDIGKSWAETNFKADIIPELVETWLRSQIRYENENIANLGKLDDYSGMGTTLEAIFIGQGFIVAAHIGDSRTYLVRGGRLQQITTDHSLVQELVAAGELTPEEAENHPRKNIITRSLGQAQEAIADVQVLDIKAGDLLLMNSDGLTNMVKPDTISKVLAQQLTLDEKAHLLITAANEHGGLDNITVILVHLDADDAVKPERKEIPAAKVTPIEDLKTLFEEVENPTSELTFEPIDFPDFKKFQSEDSSDSASEAPADSESGGDSQ